MSLKKLIADYASFNEWGNRVMTDWLLTLDVELLKRETPASFNTIQKTLQHINVAQMFWLDFITGKDVSNFNWNENHDDPAETIKSLTEVSEELKRTSISFDESQLSEKLTLDMPWAKNSLCRYDYLMHVINHGTYHRGQIINLARSVGVENGFPKTDLNIFHSDF